jgi:hypothetical protein
MDSVVPLPASEHHQFQLLLPWFVTGKLDQLEHARVENHLAACAQCQAQLKLERWFDVEISVVPLEVEHSWHRPQAPMASEPEPPPRAGHQDEVPFTGHGRRVPGVLSVPAPGWPIAASCALLLLLLAVGLWTLPGLRSGQYEAVGAPPTDSAGNAVVTFRPDVPESAMRETLNASGARIVDGPTAADAYVLHVPHALRVSALAKLRASSAVVMAQPIDPGPRREPPD